MFPPLCVLYKSFPNTTTTTTAPLARYPAIAIVDNHYGRYTRDVQNANQCGSVLLREREVKKSRATKDHGLSL